MVVDKVIMYNSKTHVRITTNSQFQKQWEKLGFKEITKFTLLNMAG